MKTPKHHGSPKAGRMSVEVAPKAASIQSKIEKIRKTWDTFRKAETVRVSIPLKHHYSSAFDRDQAAETLPVAALATILQQHFEEQIQELNEEIVALGFEPTILSLEPRSEEEASE